MSAEDFKKSYVRWSYAAALCIPTFICGVGLCDALLGFDFSSNMYLMSFIATAVMLSLLSLTWISVLNSKLFKELLSTRSAPIKVPKDGEQETQPVKLTDIELCIRKEGFVPIQENNYISFKVSGEEVNVFYDDEKLSLVRTYGLDNEVNIDVLSRACSMLHDSTFLIRSSIHKYDNNQMGLVFEVQTMISSPAQLDRYFGRYLNLLYHGIERHRDFYGKLLEESVPEVRETPTVHEQEHKMLS